VARSQSNYEQAAALYDESLALSRQVGDRWLLAIVLHNTGHVAQYQGDYDRAVALAEESLTIWQDIGHKRGIALCLAALAGVAAMVGHLERAARLLGATDALLETIGKNMEPADQAEYDRYVAAIRAQLDASVFIALWTEGKTMTLERMVAYARRQCH
jgi:tetratricopeptide (TPR) repeat protein